MKALLEKLNLNDTLNKTYKTQKKFNKVWLEIPHKEDYNLMCDLVEFVKTPQNYKYLFTIVDLYTLDFDCEPLKSKTPDDVLDAMKKCFKRNYVEKPYASISTDGGNEFKGIFHKWVYDENIYHKVGLPYRHKQQSVIESLNNQITKIIMLYINKKSKENGKEFTNWVEIIPDVRKELNTYRNKIFENRVKKFKDYDIINQEIKNRPKFKIGDIVHFKLDYPENFNMEKQTTPQFRNGDYRYSQTVRKIVKVIFMNSYPFYRYMLEGLPNVSFSEYELLPSDKKESTFKVKSIIGKKQENKIKYYLVWWENLKRSESSWEPEQQLLEDGMDEYIKEFEKNYRKKLKNRKK